MYRSKANPIFRHGQIQEMLEKARSFNNQNRITGCLLYYEGEFLQYLEGSRMKVLNLYETIKNDSRHSEITLLSHCNISAREFDSWEMAYEDFLGTNHQLQYLKLLVSSFIENPSASISPNPTSRSFWNAAEKLLRAKSLENN